MNLNLNFEAADVTKPLLSIPELADKGHEVILRKRAGEIRTQTGEKVPLIRKGKAYYLMLETEVFEDELANMAGFARRG